MKYPDPTFLTKAESVRSKRHTRTIVILSVLGALTLLLVFVARVAKMQDVYREQFPELVGAGTSTAETTEETTSEEETTQTETTTTTTETTALAPVIIITEETETEPSETPETTQNNMPDTLVLDNVYFSNSHPLQTLSHEEREMLLDDLKQSVQDYMAEHPDERMSFRYINLQSNETLGINDLDPIIPAGAFTLPVEIACSELIAAGRMSGAFTVTYMGEAAPGNSSYIADNYEPGKVFYIRTLLNLAITRNDNLALGYIIDRAGGLDALWRRISGISSYIDYTGTVTYTDFTGVEQRGPSRSSAYDMANYAEYLYRGYINDPDVYQDLINDLADSEIPSGLYTAFPDASLILHCAGRNVETSSYTDVAIIDAEEPIVLVISCECASLDRANTIQADLGTFMARFIRLCHS